MVFLVSGVIFFALCRGKVTVQNNATVHQRNAVNREFLFVPRAM